MDVRREKVGEEQKEKRSRAFQVVDVAKKTKMKMGA